MTRDIRYKQIRHLTYIFEDKLRTYMIKMYAVKMIQRKQDVHKNMERGQDMPRTIEVSKIQLYHFEALQCLQCLQSRSRIKGSKFFSLDQPLKITSHEPFSASNAFQSQVPLVSVSITLTRGHCQKSLSSLDTVDLSLSLRDLCLVSWRVLTHLKTGIKRFSPISEFETKYGGYCIELCILLM